MRKKSLVGWTTKEWAMVWTVYNTVNVAFVIQKTKQEAMARYDSGALMKDIRKVRITIEELKED